MTPRTLVYAGRTPQGHYRLLAASKSRPGAFNAVLLSGDRRRVSCCCTAARRHPLRRDERLTVERGDVLGGQVRACWHVEAAAAWVPPVEVTEDGDGSFLAYASESVNVAALRRVARVIRRAGGVAEVVKRRVGWPDRPDVWGWLLDYSIDRHGGEYDGSEYCLWTSVCILSAFERLGYNTEAVTDLSEDVERFGVVVWKTGRDRMPHVRGFGPDRTLAAVAAAVAVEWATRGGRR